VADNLMNIVKVRVHAFIIGHTIGAEVTSRADIKLVNEQKGLFRLEKIQGSHPLTDYDLFIDNPSALNLSYVEGGVGNNRINDIVLAMNLSLTEAALSREGSILTRPIFQTNEKENAKAMSGGKQQPMDGNKQLQVNESINISESVGFVLGRAQQQLDESTIITKLNLIDRAERHVQDHQGNIAKHNLTKALGHYEKAFKHLEGEEIFKDIFNAVEEAINWDRGRDGSILDNELSAVANIPRNKAEDWRSMYVRLKHPDHKQQPAEYLQAKSKISNELVPLRLAANAVFSDRLTKL
jgi:hypothetical protein